MVCGGDRSDEDPGLLALGVARCLILPILLPILCSKTF